MELKVPTPLGDDEGKEKRKKNGKKSITDRILDIAIDKKESKKITFPDIYLPKRKSVVKRANEEIELKSPTPLGEDDEKRKKKSEVKETEIPEIFRPQREEKEYKREIVDDSMSLKTPTPLGEKINLPSIDIKKVDITKIFKKIANYPSIKQIRLSKPIKDFLNLPLIQKFSPKTLFKKKKAINITKEQKKKIAYASIFVVPLLVFISLVLAILIYTRSEPFNIAQNFLEKIEQRDSQGAFALTTQAYQAITTKKEFEEIVTRLNSVDLRNAKRKRKRIDDEGIM